MKTKKQYLKQRGLKDANNNGDFDNISPNTAREILHNKTINGKPLTDEQRRLFGFLSKGNTKEYDGGGIIPTKDQNPFYGTDLPNDFSQKDYLNSLQPYSSNSLKQNIQTNPADFKTNAPRLQPVNQKEQEAFPTNDAIAAASFLTSLYNPKQPRQYVRPENQKTYNAIPYGNGSQAIMEDGGKIKKQIGNKKKYNLTDELVAHAKDPIEFDGGKNAIDLAKISAKQTGINPDLLLSSAWQEGMNKAVIHPNEISNGYKDNEKNLQGFPVDGFLNYGVDRIGESSGKLKKYLPDNFDQNMKTYKTTNEKNQPIVTAAFKTNQDALTAKSAMLKNERDNVENYAKKNNIRLSNNDLDYFNLASYNYGTTGAQGMLDEFQKSSHQDRFVADGLTSKKGVHKNIMPRIDNIPQADNLINPHNIYPGIGGQDDTYSINNKPVSPMAKNGGTWRKNNQFDNGGLQTGNGGNAPQTSYNPLDGGMGEFKGASHEQGGIEATYNGKPFEAEGGEPYRIDHQGNLEIFGDLTNPLTKRKFKTDGKIIAKQEKKVQKYIDSGEDIVNNATPTKDKFELLKFNSGTAMLKGGMGKQQELVESKNQLSSLQNMLLANKEDKKAKNGKKVMFKNGGMMLADGGKIEKYKALARKYSEKYGVNPDVIEKIINTESGFNPLAKSKAGAKGIMQFMPKTATKDYGLKENQLQSNNDADVEANIEAGVKHYASLLKTNHNDETLAVAAYNMGQGNLNDFIKSSGKSTDKYTGNDLIQRLDWKNKNTPSKNKNLAQNQTRDYIQNIVGNKTNPEKFRNEYYTGDLITPTHTDNFQPWDITQTAIKEHTNSTVPVDAYPTPKTPNFTPSQKQPFTPLKKTTPWEQILPAVPQLLDKTDPVLMQQFQPELYNDYSVSLQDRRNRNQAQLTGLKKSYGSDLSAAGALGAQAYEANNAIDAEEFRTNQGIFNEIENKNISLLNDTQSRNLGLADQQYTRQSQAKTNTENRKIDAAIQIGDVMAKNNLENKTLDVTSQLYRDYKYNDKMQLQYVGPESGSQINDSGVGNSASYVPKQTEVSTRTGDTTVKDIYGRTSSAIPNFNNLPKANLFTNYGKKKKDGGKLSGGKISKLMFN